MSNKHPSKLAMQLVGGMRITPDAEVGAKIDTTGMGRAESLEEMFNRTARQNGKTTISQVAPSGAVMVWVTAEEKDPLTALMAAALSIMIRRGHDPDAKSGVSIRRVTEVTAPGCNFFWQVTDGEGVRIASGYAVDELEASQKISEHMKLRPAS